ncbi:hypothetical protein F8178_19125 [Haloechinothrix sp. LS1_15]|nr:hypothetical protein [Haloechinothrix sp. LS1_15]
MNTSVSSAAREVEEFLAAGGWDQPVQLFALVATDELLAKQPDLREQLDPRNPLTPVAQDQLPESDLAEALAGIVWPDTVHGCALAQEIIVLPPEAEQDLPDSGEDADGSEAGATPDAERLRRAAADHPHRTEARLVAAVTRDGARACVMRLRAQQRSGDRPGDQHSADEEPLDLPVDEVIEHPDLAPNLLDALEATLYP